MEDKVEIPITVEYFGEDPLWKHVSSKDEHKEVELAKGVKLRYNMTDFKLALGHPQVDWFSLIIVPFIIGYVGHRAYPYIDKAIDKLVALIRQGDITAVKIGSKKILVMQYSEEDLKRIIKEAIDEYIRGE